MENLIALAVSMEMSQKLAEAKSFERIEDALLHEDRMEILQETERMALEVVDKVTKSDADILMESGVEGLNAKDEFFKSIVKTNYEILGFPELNPFECGISVEEVKMRSL